MKHLRAGWAGMAARHDSLEDGPAFDWDLGPVAVSLSLFTDLTHSSRGGSGRLYVIRDMVKDDTWSLTAFAGMERIGNRVADYFFGVSGSYRLGQTYALVFGMQTLRLGGSLAHSPIVDTRLSSVGWLGLAIRL